MKPSYSSLYNIEGDVVGNWSLFIVFTFIFGSFFVVPAVFAADAAGDPASTGALHITVADYTALTAPLSVGDAQDTALASAQERMLATIMNQPTHEQIVAVLTPESVFVLTSLEEFRERVTFAQQFSMGGPTLLLVSDYEAAPESKEGR